MYMCATELNKRQQRLKCAAEKTETRIKHQNETGIKNMTVIKVYIKGQQRPVMSSAV